MNQAPPVKRMPVYPWLFFSFIALLYMLISGCSSSNSSAPVDSVETCYDVSITYTGFNKTHRLCTTREHGGNNGLGVYRFLRFTLPATTNVNIQVVTVSGINPSDPDLVLFKNGLMIDSALSQAANFERLQLTLNSGDYTVELSEYRYVSDLSKSNNIPSAIELANFRESNIAAFNLPAAMDVISSPPCNTGNDNIVSGVVTFDRVLHSGTSLDYNSIVQLPLQEALVTVVCNGQEYSAGLTDQNGSYSLSFPAGQDSFVRVYAQLKQTGTPGWDFSVVNNTIAGQPTYAMQNQQAINQFVNKTQNLHAGSGWTGLTYEASQRIAAPFAILDSVRKAKNKVLFESPNAIFPQLKINWSADNTTSTGSISLGQIGTSFFDGTEIFLLGQQDNDTDEFDEHVIVHEWGHYFEANFSRSDSVGGPHTSGDVLDVRVAFGEGFGNAFSAMVLDDAIYIDVTGLSQSEGFFLDVEDNNCMNPGWYSECSVQSILYDLYDISDDGADTLTLGFSPIYSVLTTHQKETPAFTSIFSFTKSLKTIFLDNTIDDITSAQGIDPVLDIYGDSQISNNPGNTSKLPLHQEY